MAFNVHTFYDQLHHDPRVAADELRVRFKDEFFDIFGEVYALSVDSIVAYNLIIDFLDRAELNSSRCEKIGYDIDHEMFQHACDELEVLVARKITGEVTAENVSASVEGQLDNYFGKRKYESGFAVLDGSQKLEVHGHLNKIREIIETSALSTRKKNRLFNKLTKLSGEVDKDGTDTDIFFAFLGDAGFALGEMAENAKPFTTEVKDMMRIVLRSREKQEGTNLPSPDKNPLLPSSE